MRRVAAVLNARAGAVTAPRIAAVRAALGPAAWVTHDLDEAAIRAFNRAGPFPNPPNGLLQETGSVDIRWDFILRT